MARRLLQLRDLRRQSSTSNHLASRWLNGNEYSRADANTGANPTDPGVWVLCCDCENGRPAAFRAPPGGLVGTGWADQDFTHDLATDAPGVVRRLRLPLDVDAVGLLSERVLSPSRLNNLSDCGSMRGYDSTTDLASVHSLQPVGWLQGRLISLEEIR
jgi:hypothetical protein